MAILRSIGVMSGTSADGVDAIMLGLGDVATPHLPEVLARASVPFAPALQAELTRPDQLSLARLTELHFLLPRYYAEAVRLLPNHAHAACVGMHGQTVVHNVASPPPAPRGTLQIGSSAALAADLGLHVVADMRAADVALGGQGAPLVPFCHWFFCRQPGLRTLVVNFGGICNVSLVPERACDVVGFDVGPGMMLSDAFAVMHSNGALSCDRDGALSHGGRRHTPLYQEILRHPFVLRQAPKSAGREEFGASFFGPLLQRYGGAVPAQDVAYTLLDATIGALQGACRHHPKLRQGFDKVILAGGGAFNPTLVALAQTQFAGTKVEVVQNGPLAPQNHEAAAMALIAARTLRGLPSGLSQVTGARYDAVLGHVHAPPGRREVAQR